jgi:hypothetical protein
MWTSGFWQAAVGNTQGQLPAIFIWQLGLSGAFYASCQLIIFGKRPYSRGLVLQRLSRRHRRSSMGTSSSLMGTCALMGV